MYCLHCSREIPKDFFEQWDQTKAAKKGLFRCPHCAADHVRREIGRLASGEPEYSIRLWGHPTRFRRKKEGEGRTERPSS
jgi:DNA-directed RNA polymerase subunit RPC12/RpoP